jgi:hypothetical protein
MKYVSKHSAIAVLILIATALTPGACDAGFLSDARENPNSPQEAPVEMQLPGLIGEFSFGVVSGWPTILSARFTQQTSSNGSPYYYNLDRYQLGQPWFTWDDPWTRSYTDIMKNARRIIEQAQEEEAPHYAGIARLIYVWSLSYVTDGWGDVPLREAFEPTNTTPAYDPQEEVYGEIFSQLDEAIAELEEDHPLSPGSDDLLYEGNMDKWVKAAYTLKARLLMRLTEAPGHDAADQAQQALQALQNGFQSSADDAEFQHVDEQGSRNPWYRVRDELDHHQMAAQHIDLLKSLDDPRLSVQAEPADAYLPEQEAYIGHESGTEGLGVDSVSTIGLAYTAPDAPGRWITYAEAKFIGAEAHQILGDLETADEAYREGIRVNMRKYGIASDEIDAYLDTRPSLTESGNPLRDIITQKYIANFLTAEPWNDWRRTGYPELEPAEQAAIDGIPVRYAWPASELSNNMDNIEASGLPTDRNVMLHRVWWDTTPSPGAQ